MTGKIAMFERAREGLPPAESALLIDPLGSPCRDVSSIERHKLRLIPGGLPRYRQNKRGFGRIWVVPRKDFQAFRPLVQGWKAFSYP